MESFDGIVDVGPNKLLKMGRFAGDLRHRGANLTSLCWVAMDLVAMTSMQ